MSLIFIITSLKLGYAYICHSCKKLFLPFLVSQLSMRYQSGLISLVYLRCSKKCLKEAFAVWMKSEHRMLKNIQM